MRKQRELALRKILARERAQGINSNSELNKEIKARLSYQEQKKPKSKPKASKSAQKVKKQISSADKKLTKIQLERQAIIMRK